MLIKMSFGVIFFNARRAVDDDRKELEVERTLVIHYLFFRFLFCIN